MDDSVKVATSQGKEFFKPRETDFICGKPIVREN